jgi:hypothetical protein
MLRFVVVFGVLLVLVVLSGRAVQPNLVPFMYLLLAAGFAGYVWLEARQRAAPPPPELDESDWLSEVTRHLMDCGSARVYIRYFRDPESGKDERLENKREKVHEIMMRFSHLLINHEDRFFLIGFRKKAWLDDPKAWLVKNMMKVRPDLLESSATDVVDKHVLVIHDEPQPNSSTIYLIDDRLLFFNRVTLINGIEKKTYHAEDLSNSIMPLLIKRGFDEFFHKS